VPGRLIRGVVRKVADHLEAGNLDPSKKQEKDHRQYDGHFHRGRPARGLAAFSIQHRSSSSGDVDQVVNAEGKFQPVAITW
jgi:hypothetical protein